jgi:hypothetical protein
MGANYCDLFQDLIHHPDDPRTLEGLRFLGGKGIPFVRFWACGFWPADWGLYFEDKAEWFRRMDLVVRTAEEAGVGLVPSVFWRTETYPDLFDEYQDAWADPESRTRAFMATYVREIVTRYLDSPAIWGWEFANEMNLGCNLPNGMDFLGVSIPEVGVDLPRHERNLMTFTIAGEAFEAFAREVRRYDPHRFITTGNAGPRPSSWHNRHEGTWHRDTPEQVAEVFEWLNPAPVDVVSVHTYPIYGQPFEFADAQGLEAVFSLWKQHSAGIGMPLFVGEFSASAHDKDGALTMAQFREHQTAILEAMLKARVDLGAYWVFDYSRHREGPGLIRRGNEYAWVLDQIVAYDRRLREGDESAGSTGPAMERGNRVSVSAPAQSVTILRETPHGSERMLSLKLENPAELAYTDLTLHCRTAAGPLSRALVDLPPGTAWDTVWIPEAETGPLRGHISQADGTVLWAGSLAVPPIATEQSRIPMSPTVAVEDLQPLTLRGTNYYPRHQPWPGLWRAMDEDAFEAEFEEMDSLHINTIRTFYMFDAEAGLHREDGSFTPELLARVNTFLTVADRHRIKIMLCLYGGGGPPWSELPFWHRYIRTGLEPFIHDGRILMWDLMNEPGGDAGPKATPELASWLQTFWPELRQTAPEHMATVGLCWQFDQLWDLGIQPEVGQFHNYSGAVGVQPLDGARVRNVADDLRAIIADYTGERPLVIGEFGLYSETGEETSDAEREAALEHQADIYRWVLEAAETVGIAGVYNWTAFQFVPAWMGHREQHFGIIRPDGSLKPAGRILQETYARWRAQRHAPWERTAGTTE